MPTLSSVWACVANSDYGLRRRGAPSGARFAFQGVMAAASSLRNCASMLGKPTQTHDLFRKR